jgi:DIS3-like exonuclease 2
VLIGVIDYLTTMTQQQTSQSSAGSSRKAGGGQKNKSNGSNNINGRNSSSSSSKPINANNREEVDGQPPQRPSNNNKNNNSQQRQRQHKKNNNGSENKAATDNNKMKESHTQTKKNTSKAKGPHQRNNTAKRNDNDATKDGNNDGNSKQSTNRNKKQSTSAKRPNSSKSNGKSKKEDEKAKPDASSSSAAQNNNDNKSNNNGGDNTTAATKKKKRTARTKKINYPPHATHSSCLQRYNSSMSMSSTTSSILSSTTSSTTGRQIIRGKLRALPSSSSNNNNNRGGNANNNKANAFVTCDRGLLARDVVIQNDMDRNRALDGDYVFVELLDDVVTDGGDVVDDDDGHDEQKQRSKDITMGEFMDQLNLNDDDISESCLAEMEESETDIKEEEGERWHDDEVQMSLWDPVLNLRKRLKKKNSNVEGGDDTNEANSGERQYSGRVICIVPPSGAGQQASEFKPEDESFKKLIPKRTIVGTLTKLPDGNRYLLVPNNKCLPRFMCPAGTKEVEEDGNDDANADEAGEKSKMLYQAEYVFGSWSSMNKWPPCTNVRKLCGSCNVEDETKALLVENGVDHGDFPAAVLRDVDKAVESGRFLESNTPSDSAVEKDMGWKPTEEMCRGRRDYRNHRIFTIDPTTAKDLDDALHITPLPDGRVEIGVHIADVSHFIQPGSAVDEEALRRATTVYLVNDVIPMLPRPLCEIACSLNENVERLAFSVVWRMNLDGTLSKKGGRKGKNKPPEDDIWYGRTVIKSCARLDYATAQNIIDGKVATGEAEADETFWPKSRQPTGGHTIDQVAADVRLMHKVAMARRKLRFGNGALALNGIKLAFQLEDDGETPKLCAPYPIRDSNRLIEEYMLLANYFVAQRLITHAHGRALLRNHSPPIELGMQSVVDVSKEALNFDIDTTNSSTLQASLSRLSRECDDELVVQCVTESLMTPMKPAEYIAAGELSEEDWHHFALNIPYYTHFTSPIRRYPDVIVHRLLQATIDDNVDEFPQNQSEIHSAAGHCNEKRMAAKKAQERSDRVFLSLYLKKNPITSTLGVCLSVGEKTFTVFVPKLGASIKVFLQEHEDCFNTNAYTDDDGKRHIVINPKTDLIPGMQPGDGTEPTWKSLDIRVFTKLEVSCTCKARPPIDVRVKVVGPWKE